MKKRAKKKPCIFLGDGGKRREGLGKGGGGGGEAINLGTELHRPLSKRAKQRFSFPVFFLPKKKIFKGFFWGGGEGSLWALLLHIHKAHFLLTLL